MKYLFYLSILLLTSCRPSGVKSNTSDLSEPLPDGKWRITLYADNLSEDFSRLSTKNDELLLLMYEYKDSATLGQPIMDTFLIADSLHREHVFFNEKPFGYSDEVIFFLVEKDTDVSSENIDLILREKYEEVRSWFYKRDYVNLEKILGDEDVLGIKVIKQRGALRKVEWEWSGIHRADRYLYRMEIYK